MHTYKTITSELSCMHKLAGFDNPTKQFIVRKSLQDALEPSIKLLLGNSSTLCSLYCPTHMTSYYLAQFLHLYYFSLPDKYNSKNILQMTDMFCTRDSNVLNNTPVLWTTPMTTDVDTLRYFAPPPPLYVLCSKCNC